MGSLTAAAHTLAISQPSATKMLQELESALGCTLVDRNTRGGVLSVEGERALERLNIATGALDAIRQTLSAPARAPIVRIGMLPLAGVALIPQMVATLSAQRNLPRLQLREGSVSGVLHLLRNGEVDCVIGRTEVGDTDAPASEFTIVPLSNEQYEVAASAVNPLVREHKLSLQRLSDHPWIMAPGGTFTRQIFETAFVSIGLEPPVPGIESASVHTNLTCVSKSGLLTLAPRSAVELYSDLGLVKKLKLAQPFQSNFLVFLTHAHTNRFPALQLVQETLQRVANQQI